MERKGGPDGAPEAEREEGEPEVKKRRLLCVEFASVASCDAAVAQCYLAENDWEIEVRFRCFSLSRSLLWSVQRTRSISVSLFCRERWTPTSSRPWRRAL